MGAHQKIENRTYVQFSNSSPGYLSKENKNTNSKRYTHPVFIVALFIIAEIWKQPRCLSMDEQIKMWNTCDGTLLSHKKE